MTLIAPSKLGIATLLLLTEVTFCLFAFIANNFIAEEIDKEILIAMHPERKGALVDITVLNERLPVCLKLLNMPSKTTSMEMADETNRRIREARNLHLNALTEARYVMNLSCSAVPDRVVKSRTIFLDSVLSIQAASDPRYGTHCAGFDWYSPFKLITENK